MHAFHSLSLQKGPKSGSIKGAETDQETGDLIRPYIYATIPNIRRQNEGYEFKSALWQTFCLESLQGSHIRALLFLPKVASRKYRLPLDKNSFDPSNFYTQASYFSLQYYLKSLRGKSRTPSFYITHTRCFSNFRGKRITLRSLEPRIFPGKGVKLGKVLIIYHLTISEKEWSQSHDSL